MVEKVSVNVQVLALNTDHNFLIPWDMGTEDATALILQLLCDEYPGASRPLLHRNKLLQRSSGKMLNPSCSLRQQGIVHGERLLLI